MVFTKDSIFLNLVRGEREHDNYGITHTLPYPLVSNEEKKTLLQNYKTSYPPAEKFLIKTSKLHSGYRSVFTWYMWRSIDPVDVEY
jgi:hypothetical protein